MNKALQTAFNTVTMLWVMVTDAVASRAADLFWLAGLASVAFGVSMIYVPAGVIAAGLGLCFMGFALGSAGDAQ